MHTRTPSCLTFEQAESERVSASKAPFWLSSPFWFLGTLASKDFYMYSLQTKSLLNLVAFLYSLQNLLPGVLPIWWTFLHTIFYSSHVQSEGNQILINWSLRSEMHLDSHIIAHFSIKVCSLPPSMLQNRGGTNSTQWPWTGNRLTLFAFSFKDQKYQNLLLPAANVYFAKFKLMVKCLLELVTRCIWRIQPSTAINQLKTIEFCSNTFFHQLLLHQIYANMCQDIFTNSETLSF